MTDKTHKKPMLEYDPLSWLKDDSETPAPKKKAAAKSKKTAAKKSAPKDVVEEATETVAETDAPDQAATAEPESVAGSGPGEPLSLGTELTIKNVADFKHKIETRLSKENEIRLDPAELVKIDTAGLQLLLSLRKSLSETGGHLHWAGQSPVLDSAARMIGLEMVVDDNAYDEARQSSGSGDSNPGFGFF